MPAPHDHTKSPLGKPARHSRTYDPGHLCPVPRTEGRVAEGLNDECFSRCFGEDLWNLYELAWLDENGKPDVAMAEIRVPMQSPNLIESKSLKLYLNSLNMTAFSDATAVSNTLIKDLSAAAGTPVKVRLIPPDRFGRIALKEAAGICIDDQIIAMPDASVNPAVLKILDMDINETLFSRLFRSVCPVTGQPDFATVIISYQGRRLDPGPLLRYLVSFREHAGFHEACVERIFWDIRNCCGPEKLIVSARFTRRGGIDINPWRATVDTGMPNRRDPRQ